MPNVDLTRIGSNIGAMYSLQSLLDINNKLAATQTRLASGKRINSAADDPAGLTIATKMKARSEGLAVVEDNISDASNMLSVAESGLSKLSDILVKMRSKATQAASDTLGTTERQTIQSQLSAFAEQIDDIISETKWNGVQLLDGTVSKTFQTGVDAGETTEWALSQKHDALTLGVANQNSVAKFSNVGYVPGSFDGSSSSGLSISSPLSGQTALKTGTYTVEMLAHGSSASGTFLSMDSQYIDGISGASATAFGSGTELASGRYSLEITSSSQTGVTGASSTYQYRITNMDTGSVVANVSSYTDMSTATGSSGVLMNGGSSLGVKLDITGQMTVGDKFNFEYVKSTDAKYALKDSQNQAQTVDMDGASSGSALNTFGYYSGGSADVIVDTGRGIRFTSSASANFVNGHKWNFDFEEAGDYVINVSTSEHAAAYMTKVTNAMDVVNQSMADLGSLMARMTIKQEAASSARINVESAYSRIMNANMAEEQVNASKYLVLQQTAVAMLAQANQAPQAMLSLFR